MYKNCDRFLGGGCHPTSGLSAQESMPTNQGASSTEVLAAASYKNSPRVDHQHQHFSSGTGRGSRFGGARVSHAKDCGLEPMVESNQ